MKLIKARIDGFGAVRNKTIEYAEGLNSVCEQNGFGKSTESAFIKAMLFGLEERDKQSVLTDRRHFFPGKGVPFGGYLELEYGGDTYRITRSFGEKHAGDREMLTKNGVDVKWDMCPDLFGTADADSFMRTLSVNAADIDVRTTDGINARLMGIAQGGESDDRVAPALTALKKKEKDAKGKAASAGADVTRLEGEIYRKQVLFDSLPQMIEERDLAKKERDALAEKMETFRAAESVGKDWAIYDSYLAKAREEKGVCTLIEERYAHGVPTEAELDETYDALAAEKSVGMGLVMSEKDTERLEVLSRAFSGGIPGGDELRELDARISAYAQKDAEYRSSLNRQYVGRDRELLDRFGTKNPGAGFTEKLDGALSAYNEAERELSVAKSTGVVAVSETTASVKSHRSVLFVALLIVSAVILIAGVVLAVAVDGFLVAGLITAAAGLVALVIFLILYINSKSAGTQTAASPARYSEGLDALTNKRDAAYRHLVSLIAPYSTNPSADIAECVFTVKKDYGDYTELLSESDRAGKERVALADGVNRMKSEIDSYFAAYGIPAGDVNEMRTRLIADMTEYRTLKDTAEGVKQKKEDAKRALADQTRLVDDFCSKYGFRREDLLAKKDRIRADAKNYRASKTQMEGYEKDAESFKEESGLIGERPLVRESAEKLSETELKYNNACERYLGLERDIAAAEAETGDLEGLKTERDARRADLTKHSETEKLLSACQEFLTQADAELRADYIRPVQEGFDGYAKKYELATGKTVEIRHDAKSDFKTEVTQGGVTLTDAQLSSGERSILAYLFRMALIERMYPDEKPFIILDDPFVNLDEGNFEKVTGLVKDVAGSFQTLYFTCHASRRID
ncbi:MAG: hypothetical protein LUD47_02635 [Clostridia bacterium]|nr:hypothetical protein [Clostridia bacterium]